MIKIEVRQNKVFESGYPYNSSVDDYFKSLSADFINNYGLDSATVLQINNHKNETLEFDRKLHEFVFKLSAFIVGFETTGHILIDEFNELIASRNFLESELKLLKNNRVSTSGEYNFVLSNITQLNSDIEKINEFIEYYQSQVIDDSYSFSDSYIADTQSSLNLIEGILIQNETEFTYYQNALYSHITPFADIKNDLTEYSFFATTLRSMYEEWQKRTEVYYQNLVAYYKNDYDNNWTYGTSLMYGQKIEEEASSIVVYKSISDRWQDTLFKRHNFTIEKEVKEFSLAWLNSHPKFDNEEFMYSIESKKVEIVRREIVIMEQMVIDKRQAIRSVIPYAREQNYFKYRELTLAKIKYTYMNINGSLDQSVLDSYDSQLSDLQVDYNYVTSKQSQVTYWKNFTEWEMYSELLTDLKRQLDKSEKAIIREFKKDTVDNREFLEKIEFYTKEKNDLEAKIVQLVGMKEKLEIENNVSDDEVTLIESKVYENQALITQKRNEYILFFSERVPFFTQNIAASEMDGIVELLKGNYFRNFDDQYKKFLEYSTTVGWFNDAEREKLVTLYGKILNVVSKNLAEQWEREFSNQILDTRKIVIYQYYFDKELKAFYGLINKHLLNGVYDMSSMNNISKQVTVVKSVFKTYAEIAFNIRSNITVITSAFDYNETFTFTISENNENRNNVEETFNQIIDDITAFTFNKNISFKVNEDSIDKQEKIDQVWLDMEKKYV